MKSLSIVLSYFFPILLLFAITTAESCSADCKREDNCACASTVSPLPQEETPQFITLTFDDAVTRLYYNEYYSKLLHNRTNPDGSPISATFYVPHSYTDYQIVNNLYNEGFEIGLHSVTKNSVDYWKIASAVELRKEFVQNRRIISTFANLSTRAITGVRTPHLQIAGDRTFRAYVNATITYDSSWVVRSNKPLFPFTLDHGLNEECLIGTCPNESYPGIWIVPIINFNNFNTECNALVSCVLGGSPENIRDWLINQFERIYNRNRAPITFMLNAAWFQMVDNSFEGFSMFLDYLHSNENVFLVSHQEVIKWSRNPIGINDYKPNNKISPRRCDRPSLCTYKFGQYEERLLAICRDCPEAYPWLGNPEGNLN